MWINPYCGKIYKGTIYVVQLCFLGNKKEHVYHIYKNESYEEISVVPADTDVRSYAGHNIRKNEKLHLYTYNVNDEHTEKVN